MFTTATKIEGLNPFPVEPRLRFDRLRLGLMWLYAVAVAVTIAIPLNSARRQQEEALDVAELRAEGMARAIEQHIARLLDGAGQFLLETREIIEADGGQDGIRAQSLQHILATQYLHEGALRPLYVFDAEGRRRATAPELAQTAVDISDRASFAWHREHRDRAVRVSAPVQSPIDHQWIIPVSVRLDRPDGSFDGVLTIALETQALSTFYRSVGSDDDSAISLMGVDGTLYMRTPAANELAGRKAWSAQIESALKGRQEGLLRAQSPIDGVARLIAFRKVNGYPLYVTFAASRDHALAEWRADNFTRVVVVVMAIVLYTLFVLLLLRRVDAERGAVRNLLALKSAVDRCADELFLISHDGRVVYTNESAARNRGIPRGLTRTVSVSELSPQLCNERWSDVWAALREHGEIRLEAMQHRFDGSEFPGGIAASYLTIDHAAYCFAIVRDLTAEKRKEHEVRELNATLEERVRIRTEELARANAELESFSYSASHDLRAPLVAIEGFSQLLMEGDGALEGEVARKYLERVRRASRRMRDLIDNMLKLSRISFADLSLQRIDLSWMASDILKELSFASPERRVRIDIEPDIFAEADAGLIRIALENLLGNAWKYSAHHKAAHIEFGKRTENGEEVLFVRDNGVGFDMAHADKLFTPFQRLHPDSQFSGTGVGLATVRRVVDRHQGRIWAEGVPGEGASFYFTLDAGSRG